MKIDFQVRSFSPIRPVYANFSSIASSYDLNTRYFTRDGHPYMVISGELHFSRLPRERWRETLLKMKECGCNAVSTYVFWNHHEEKKDAFDFSGDKDIHAFLEICREIQMPCILRIGPWCHGEVVYGGLPARIQKMEFKRTNDVEYLAEVGDFWAALAQQTLPFMDGRTVIGIQIENEYDGDICHLDLLKSLAVEKGFRAPFFTMTAWPGKQRTAELMPLSGGYPDAPWTSGILPLTDHQRFSFLPEKSEDEIGTDLREAAAHEATSDGQLRGNGEDGEASSTNAQPTSLPRAAQAMGFRLPQASCEIGPGNQVTHRRRPVIEEKDGYGIAFAKLAGGMNWFGYYMFCGGRNPNDGLWQESTQTGYPNDLPIIDYDFQAPISRYGFVRPHGDRLRLLHMMMTYFDPLLPERDAFFPENLSSDDRELRCSIRVNEEGSGYFFASAYEKGFSMPDFMDVAPQITLSAGKGTSAAPLTISLPHINVHSGVMVCYPFNMKIGQNVFDYILGQPLVQYPVSDDPEADTVCYLVELEGIRPTCSVGGTVYPLNYAESGTVVAGTRLIVLPFEKAKTFHFINGRPMFLDGTVYCDQGKIYVEKIVDSGIRHLFHLTEAKPCALPYDEYLYSEGERAFYSFTMPQDILDRYEDVALEFAFEGLNLQVFCDGELIDDCFNTNGKYEMRLRDYRRYIESGKEFLIRTAPRLRGGISEVYHEIYLPLNSNMLVLLSAKPVSTKEITE